jgi:hypothetical protein
MNAWGRLWVRLRGRFRGRLWVRLGVLRGFAARPLLACSGAVFAPGRVCENSMSVGNWCLTRYLPRGLRVRASGCSAVPVSCRWLSPNVCPAGAASLVPVSVSVVIAGHVDASRRLLVGLSRLVRLVPGLAQRSDSARRSTAPPSLSRRMACRCRRGGARAGYASKPSGLGDRPRATSIETRGRVL